MSKAEEVITKIEKEVPLGGNSMYYEMLIIDAMQTHTSHTLQELKEKVKGLTVELDVRYNLAITDVIALIEDMQDE